MSRFTESSRISRALGVAVTFAVIAMPVAAKDLSRTEKKIVAAVDQQIDATIDLLGRSVDIPSKTGNAEGVRKVGAIYAKELEGIGFKTRWVDLPPEMHHAGHLIAEIGEGKGNRVLLIGHLDTVLEGSPWSRDGNVGRGNGAADMKGGDVIIIAALRAMHDAGALKGANITVFFCGDEEDAGRPVKVARAPLVDEAKRSDFAVAFEGTVGNTGTIARRGISDWHLETTGKTGHSSGIFRKGASQGAIFEMARILDAFYETVRGEEYLTFNPSAVAGGTEVTWDSENNSGTAEGKTNVIAQRAVVDGDIRYVSREQFERARKAMEAIVAKNLPGTSATITFSEGYPPMAPTDRNYALLERFSEASKDLGFGEIKALDPGRRGAGDISFVADFVPCLDGLGAVGEREHSPEEWIDLEPMPKLIKRAAVLIYRLTHGVD